MFIDSIESEMYTNSFLLSITVKLFFRSVILRFMQKTSLLGNIWHFDGTSQRAGDHLAQKIGVEATLGRLLAARGYGDVEDALTFLAPKLSELPDPSHLLDMDQAVTRLEDAIENAQCVCIFGDYDVDGGCATALLVRYFRSIGVDVKLYIPDRMTEGYGPNNDAMDAIKAMGADVVITVDCGSVAFEPMAYAKEIGLDVIITDHHQTQATKPDCIALVNPNRADETSPCGMLSGAGVAFYLILAVTRSLRKKGFFNAARPEPDNRYLLDLVAVSTVCDMVPLIGPNRVLVQMGLKVLAQRRNFGLAALADVAGVDETPTAYHAGFVIGPRINAGGRISDCDIGARLLSTENPDEAEKLANQLHLLNEERKRIEQDVLAEALDQADALMSQNPPFILVSGKGWHEGVIGIVASRVKERTHRPTCILAINGDEAKGSGRSIHGVDLGKAVIDCQDILVKGGGHKMAAGLSVKTENIEKLKQALTNHISNQIEGREDDILTPSMVVDDFVSVDGTTLGFLDQLDKLAPYGAGHREPRFVLCDVQIGFAKTVGEDGAHVTLSVVSPHTGKQLKGIAFRAMESPLGHFLLQAARDKRTVSICGQLRRNVWMERTSIQLYVQDAMEGRYVP